MEMEFDEIIREIESLYQKRELSEIKEMFAQINPADIASIIEEFPNNQRVLFFRLSSTSSIPKPDCRGSSTVTTGYTVRSA